jgi:hypothetical protein
MSQSYPTRSLLGAFLEGAGRPIRRRVFISYHHAHDQRYYDALSRTLHDQMDLIFDNSLDRQIDSDDTNYVIQRIRDNFISGTSCTLVLCGPETYQRKYVDWEIKATLDKYHGLIAIRLPEVATDSQGRAIIPERLVPNYNSGYMLWKTWSEFMANPSLITSWIEDAVGRDKSKIVNAQAIKTRNG